jgi:hypothetical protein
MTLAPAACWVVPAAAGQAEQSALPQDARPSCQTRSVPKQNAWVLEAAADPIRARHLGSAVLEESVGSAEMKYEAALGPKHSQPGRRAAVAVVAEPVRAPASAESSATAPVSAASATPTRASAGWAAPADVSAGSTEDSENRPVARRLPAAGGWPSQVTAGCCLRRPRPYERRRRPQGRSLVALPGTLCSGRSPSWPLGAGPPK